jgi:hypothetical protein
MIQVVMACPDESFESGDGEEATLFVFVVRARNSSTSENPQRVRVSAKALA